MGLIPSLIVELLFIWIVVFVSVVPAENYKWIINLSAVIKMLLALTICILGIYAAFTKGVANHYTLASLFLDFNINNLSYISVILFNFMGFEVICTMSDSMENPQRQIPIAIITGGIVVSLIYIAVTYCIGVAIPTDQISISTGFIDSIGILTGKTSGFLIKIISILFLFTLFGNMISWSLGVNNVVAYAAERGDMLGIFEKRNKKTSIPTGSAYINGAVASFIVIIAPFIQNQELFWLFFATGTVTLLLAYMPMFPAFLKLRKMGSFVKREFRVPGNWLVLHVIAYLPIIIIGVAVLCLVVPFGFDNETLSSVLPITICTGICILIGEIIVFKNKVCKIQEVCYGQKN